MTDPQPPSQSSTRETIHEINNQLAVITYSAQLAASKAGDGELRAHLERIEAGARTVAELVQQLRGAVEDDASGTPVPSAAAPHGGLALIVDDSATLRQMVAAALETAGFQALAAGDGAAALDQLSARPEIDLLVTDVQMPDIDGPELAARARDLRPGLPIVFVTGEGAGTIEFDGGRAPAVAKPFSEGELVEAVRAARGETLEPKIIDLT